MSEKQSEKNMQQPIDKMTWLIILAAIQAVLLLFAVYQLGALNQSFAQALNPTAAGDLAAPAAPSAPAAPAKNIDMKALIDDDAVKGDAKALGV